MKKKCHSRESGNPKMDPRLKHSGMTSGMKMRVLVTCGATWTPIDDVRVISNVSSGEMGHLIAQAFRRNRAIVTMIEGPVTHPLLDKKIKIIKYRYFDELARVLKAELQKKYDIIIHAAAVSDFKVTVPFKRKISSDKALTLNLTATPKLIKDIKRLAPESFLVGFKLESNLNPRNILKTAKSLFTRAGCDMVVVNSLTGGYRGLIFNADGEILGKATNKQVLAQNLVKIIIKCYQ
jgi:phosphopantothenoylcysteine decarboxylase / phosphopantothenate---cysteine ligase